ncbi:MAG TPA: hypothetical protein VK613_10295 [Gaiellaceae bacterium]|nr:hypothetical protein [Gaiellaceae bacterium]
MDGRTLLGADALSAFPVSVGDRVGPDIGSDHLPPIVDFALASGKA